MNKATVKQIDALILRLESIAIEMSDQSWIESEVESLQESFDNRSEKWQESDKGSEAQEIISKLEEAMNAVREISDLAEATANTLRDAMENA